MSVSWASGIAHVEAAKTEERRRADSAKRQRLGVTPPSGPKAAAAAVCSTDVFKRIQWLSDVVATGKSKHALLGGRGDPFSTSLDAARGVRGGARRGGRARGHPSDAAQDAL